MTFSIDLIKEWTEDKIVLPLFSCRYNMHDGIHRIGRHPDVTTDPEMEWQTEACEH
jgi:hypothetical protein